MVYEKQITKSIYYDLHYIVENVKGACLHIGNVQKDTQQVCISLYKIDHLAKVPSRCHATAEWSIDLPKVANHCTVPQVTLSASTSIKGRLCWKAVSLYAHTGTRRHWLLEFLTQ